MKIGYVPELLMAEQNAKPQTMQSVKLMQVPGESSARAKLLGSVSVNEQGVAACTNPLAGTVMRVAAVRIGDNLQARQIPFELGVNRSLMLPLPENTPSKLGFFVGYAGRLSMIAALRLGEYPGAAQAIATGPTSVKEMQIGMAGIKPEEVYEQDWADQIDLYKQLGFDAKRSRGLFSRVRYTVGESTVARERFVVVPDTMIDLVEMPEQIDRRDLIQILGYTPEELVPPVPHSSAMSFGQLGTGYSRPYRTEHNIRSAPEPVNLLGAFAISLVPKV